MINLITSIYTILKLLLNKSICIDYSKEFNKLNIVFSGDIKTVRVINKTLILDYNVAYLGCEGNQAIEYSDEFNIKQRTTETIKEIELLDNLLEELNVPCC